MATRNLIAGNDGANTIAGSSGDDLIYGFDPDGARASVTDGNDKLLGGAGADFAYGGPDADTLDGGAGDDTLDGGTGVNRMTGDSGSDTFFFGATPARGHYGRISDFAHLTDTLQISASAFGGGLVAGGAVVLVAGSAPSLAGITGGVFLYGTDNGRLLWDADGKGAGAPAVVALLAGAPALDAADFLIGA